MKVTIIDYNSGNLRSVFGIFKTAAALYSIDSNIIISNNVSDVLDSDKIILPGVGSFSDCYNKLSKIPDMIKALNFVVNEKKVTFLGICVGMQLLASLSLEDSKINGFNWIPGLVTHISPSFRTPHMGWNIIKPSLKHYIFSNMPFNESGYSVYFVHSYI